MRTSATLRLQQQVDRLPAFLTPLERKAITQLLWAGDTLESFKAYFQPHSWEWCILNSVCNAVAPTNPKIAEFFK